MVLFEEEKPIKKNGPMLFSIGFPIPKHSFFRPDTPNVQHFDADFNYSILTIVKPFCTKPLAS